MSRLGELVATIKDESWLHDYDCSHSVTYRLYAAKGGYKIAFRHTWRNRRTYDSDGGAMRVYGPGSGGAMPSPPPEVEERVVVCNCKVMQAAVERFRSASIPLAPGRNVPLDDMPGYLTLKVSCAGGCATCRWMRGFPPAGWEPLHAFAEAVLQEYRDASEHEDWCNRFPDEVKERMVQSVGVNAKPECGLIRAGFVQEAKWLLEVFGRYQWSGQMTQDDTAAFQIRDVGSIEMLNVHQYSENYPYFDMTLQANCQQYKLCHKIAYVAGKGGAEVSMDREKILELVPKAFPVDVLNDGSDMATFTKERLLECLGRAKVELWVTDPRIAYAAYVAVVEQRLIDRVLEHVPTIEEATQILRHYGLYRPRLLPEPRPADEYDCMGQMRTDIYRLQGDFLPEMLKATASVAR